MLRRYLHAVSGCTSCRLWLACLYVGSVRWVCAPFGCFETASDRLTKCHWLRENGKPDGNTTTPPLHTTITRLMPSSAQDVCSSSCPPAPSSQDMLMLRCQQQLAIFLAAAPLDGECPPLPMLTKISNMPHAAAKAAATARLGNGLKRVRRPSFDSLSSGSDDELRQCEKKRTTEDLLIDAGEVWQPDPLLNFDLIEGLDAEFWRAQTDLHLSLALGEPAGGGFDRGFDPLFMAKHSPLAHKRRRPKPASSPSATKQSARERGQRSASPSFVGVVL